MFIEHELQEVRATLDEMSVGILHVKLLEDAMLVDPINHHLSGQELDVRVLHGHLVILGLLE